MLAPGAGRRRDGRGRRGGYRRGRAVQIDPVKPTLKAPGSKSSKLKYHKLVSSFAFKFNLRRCTVGTAAVKNLGVGVGGGGGGALDGVGPARYCPPRHMMPLNSRTKGSHFVGNSRNEGSNCVG